METGKKLWPHCVREDAKAQALKQPRHRVVGWPQHKQAQNAQKFQHYTHMSFVGNECLSYFIGWKYLANVLMHDSHALWEQPTHAVQMGTTLFGNLVKVYFSWN